MSFSHVIPYGGMALLFGIAPKWGSSVQSEWDMLQYAAHPNLKLPLAEELSG